MIDASHDRHCDYIYHLEYASFISEVFVAAYVSAQALGRASLVLQLPSFVSPCSSDIENLNWNIYIQVTL